MTYQTARILRGDDSRCSAAAAVDYLGLSQISSYAAGNTFVFRSSGDVSCVGAVLYRAGTGPAGYPTGCIDTGYIPVVFRISDMYRLRRSGNAVYTTCVNCRNLT